MSVVFADSADCAPCEPICSPCDSACGNKNIFNNVNFFGKNPKGKIEVYGWMLTGITVNNHGATNEYDSTAPVNGTHAYGYNVRPGRLGITDQSGNSSILMLEQPSDWKVNQLWVGAKKDLGNKFGWGFRTDLVYGTDARYARNWTDSTLDWDWGSGDYFMSFTSLYALLGTKDLNLQVGKFAGGFAYEGLAAPKEFFYSHADICYGRPFTVQGALLNANWKKFSFSGGWTAGVFQSFEDPYDDNAFLGKITYHLTDKIDISYKIFHNDKGGRFDRPFYKQRDTLQTVIFTYNISPKWFLMLETAMTETATVPKNAADNTGSAWGFNSHLIYTINKKWAVGLRGEFHHSRNSFFDMPAVTGGQGGDLYDITLAAHYKMTKKVTLRPELRYDSADYGNGYRPFGGNESKKDQVSGGVSFIVMF